MSTGFERIGKDSQLQDHWIRRLVAFILDIIIVSAITLLIAAIILVLFNLITAAGLPWYVLNPFSFLFFAGILSIPYFSLMEAYYGATLGKNIINLKVVKPDGQKPTLDLAFLRNASKIYWILVLLDTIIGLATPGDPHQKVTDRIAHTVVVSKGASPLPSITTIQQPSKNCAHCGNKMPADAKYCPHCGKEQG